MKFFSSFALTLLICVSFWSTRTHAQEVKPNYELPARFSTSRIASMVHSTGIHPQWYKDADKFWYAFTNAQGTDYWIVDPAAGTKKPLFDNVRLAAELTEIVKDPFDAKHVPIRDLKQKEGDLFTFHINSSVMVEKKKKDAKSSGGKENKKFFFEYRADKGKLTWLKEQDQAQKPVPRWAAIAPDMKKVVYSKNYNLYWMDWENFLKTREDDKDSTIVEHALTTDGVKDYAYGYGTSDLYADSAALARRTWANVIWSPDSKHFALVRSDERKVKDLWVIDVLAEPRPKLEAYKYEMPGEANIPQEELLVFDFENGSKRVIPTAAYKDQSLQVYYGKTTHKQAAQEYAKGSWMGDNDKFYFRRASRDLKRIDLCVAELACDTVRTVVEERLNTYIETMTPLLIKGGKELLWWSERSGWAQLYRYGTDGVLKNAVTSGPWHVDQMLDVDETAGLVYFLACGREAGENPYYQHLYSAKLDGSAITCLTPGNYHWNAVMTDGAKAFMATRSRVDIRPEFELYAASGRKLRTLDTVDISLLVEAGYRYPEPFTVKAADGITDLYGVMYKPYDFDPSRKYPIIEYVYPGPQVEAVNQAWSSGMERTDRLAQFGFIVITVGNRGGHPDRSKWYHNYGYGNLRDYGLADQKCAVERLASRHAFIDIERVGIHGHSGGGFMSTAAILQYPDFYDVAVSCAGNHENNIYNRWWSETHHGVLEEVSAKGDTTFKYSIDRNSHLASRLKGHLLLIHGDIDNNVHPGNTLRMVNALIKAKKRFDMLILPGQRHGFGNMREYFFWKMGDYYCKYLLGAQEESIDIPGMTNDL